MLLHITDIAHTVQIGRSWKIQYDSLTYDGCSSDEGIQRFGSVAENLHLVLFLNSKSYGFHFIVIHVMTEHRSYYLFENRCDDYIYPFGDGNRRRASELSVLGLLNLKSPTKSRCATAGRRLTTNLWTGVSLITEEEECAEKQSKARK